MGLSDYTQTLSGVPQGSILGPTLFLLFINDLPLSIKNCSADFFADDSTFHTSGKTKVDVEFKLQSDGINAGAWSMRNKLPINYDKSTLMAVGTRQKLHNNDNFDIQINDYKINNVKSQKVLGIVIDENLNWTPHVEYLCATISSRISLLKQLAAYVPVNIQKLFYQNYILPLIDYGSNAWGTTSNTNIERLNKLQKRAARIILKADFMTPSADMFKTLDWMPVNSRLIYNKAVFIYKALNDQTPAYISNLLKPTTETCTRTLRSSETCSLIVPRSRTALCDGSFSCSAPKLWNSLPNAVKKAPSLNVFKKTIKEHIDS